MNQLFKKIPNEDKQRKWTAILITLLISLSLTLIGIFLIGQYGIAMFILTPFFMGACPTILYGLEKEVTRKAAWQMAWLTLLIFTIGLLLFAIEGLICIVMAAPIAIFFTWLGTLIGLLIVKKNTFHSKIMFFCCLVLIPTTAFIEKEIKPALNSVVTAVEIEADLATVWKNVVEFPQLDPPTELLFKTGIAYPINAKMKGTGPGAIRYCNFSTGSFVEPITVWNENKLLKFNVLAQPATMKELSFWDIDAPHLHDYFVSKRGQFKLSKLPNGNTLLEGTTWYTHDIKPVFYWKGWSQYIIHQIHLRVLMHIKRNAENS